MRTAASAGHTAAALATNAMETSEMVDEDRTPEACDKASLSELELKKARQKAYRQAYYQANRERMKAQTQERRLKDPDKIKADKKTYYEANRERLKSEREAKKEVLRERTKQWRLNNPDHQKEYYLKNKEKIDERNKKNALKNKEKYKRKQKEWYENNQEKVQEYTREYNAKNKENIRAANREWYRNNLERAKTSHKKYYNQRYREDLNFKLRVSLSSRINLALKNRTARKCAPTTKLIGCSIEELKAHLEAQFQPGMSWENYGYWGWHVDHVRPCASFDLTNPEQQKACFGYANLQPLWREDNQKKSARLDWKPE